MNESGKGGCKNHNQEMDNNIPQENLVTIQISINMLRGKTIMDDVDQGSMINDIICEAANKTNEPTNDTNTRASAWIRRARLGDTSFRRGTQFESAPS